MTAKTKGREKLNSLCWVRECKEIHSLSLSLWWPSLLESAGSFTAQLFYNGNALATKLKFSTGRFWICYKRKILWEKFQPSVSFWLTSTQAMIFKNWYETFYYITIRGTWTFSVRNKISLKFSKPVYSNFFAVILSVALYQETYLCVCTCSHMPVCVSPHANKQVNKIRGNKENKQTFRVHPNFELIANESCCVSTLSGHLSISFFLKGFGDPLVGREKGRLLSSNLEHVFNKKHQSMFWNSEG